MNKLVLFFGFSIVCNLVFSQEVLVDTAYRKFNVLVVTNSVNKAPERIIKVPKEVKAVSNELIKSLNSATTADLVAASGIAYSRTIFQGGGSPIIRGFEGNRIALYVDGVRVNNLLYNSNYAQNINTIDQNILENIEIVNGPASTIYGSDAMGGVMHLRTKLPELASDTLGGKTFSGNVFGRYNSANNGQTYHADINFGDGRIASLTSISYSIFDDLKMGKSLNKFFETTKTRDNYVDTINGKDSIITNSNNLIQKGSAYNQLNVVQKILFKPEDYVSHLFNIQYSASSVIPNYAQLSEMNINKKPVYSESNFGPQKRFLIAYDFNIQPDTTFYDNLHVGVNLQDVTEGSENRLFNDKVKYTNENRAQIIGAAVDFEKSKDLHMFRYGFDGSYSSLVATATPNKSSDSTSYKRQNISPLDGSSVYSVAFYGTHNMQISEKLILSDGLRLGYSGLNAKLGEPTAYYRMKLDDGIKQSMPIFALNAGLVYLPIKKLKLYTNISTGYRIPNISDASLLYNSTLGSVLVPNKDIKPEYNYNFDLGTTFWYNENIWIENTFYATLLQNMLVIDKYQYNGKDSVDYFNYTPTSNTDNGNSAVYAQQNKGKGYILGISTKVNISFAKYWQIVGNMNFTYGRETAPTSAAAAHIPPMYAQVFIKFSKSKFTGLFIANYNSLKPLSNYSVNASENRFYASSIGTPAWLTLNLNLQYNFNDKWHLQAGVDNILDTQYRTYGSGINAAGRNIFGCLRFNW